MFPWNSSRDQPLELMPGSLLPRRIGLFGLCRRFGLIAGADLSGSGLGLPQDLLRLRLCVRRNTGGNFFDSVHAVYCRLSIVLVAGYCYI